MPLFLLVLQAVLMSPFFSISHVYFPHIEEGFTGFTGFTGQNHNSSKTNGISANFGTDKSGYSIIYLIRSIRFLFPKYGVFLTLKKHFCLSS